MKKKICIIMAILMALVCMAGCENEEPKTKRKSNTSIFGGKKSDGDTDGSGKNSADYDTIYNSVLEEYYYMIKYANNQSEPDERFMGVVEAAQAFEDEALNEIGYLITDINGDGIKELLVGISEDSDDVYCKNDIYALYTLKGESPSFVVGSRSRNWYSLIEGNKIFNCGSNGAAFRIFGEYDLSDDAELICNDFYFSFDKDGSYTNIGFFHNTTGIYDMEEADELDISEDEFREKEESYAKRTIKLNFKPFSTFTPSGDGAEVFNGNNSGDPLFMTIKGNWSTIVEADGEDLALVLDLYSDGSAAYKIGFYESEFVVYYRGRWKASSGTTAITLDMDDEYGSGPFKGEFLWNVNNDTLTLMHKSGDPLLVDMENESISFNKK